MTTPAVRLERVWKSFGPIDSLADVSFDVARGDVLALLGPNGAGKTTAVSVAVGLRAPDRGHATLFGHNPQAVAARRGLGVTPQDAAFPSTVTVGELLLLVCRHFPARGPDRELLERFGLTEVEARKAGGLSGGQKRRLALALAFAGNPELVVLDEPTAGLDVEARHALWETIRDFNRLGGSVLMTTHHLDEAEALASRVVVLHRGRVVAAGAVRAVARSLGATRIRLEAPELPELPGIVRLTRDASLWTIDCRDGDALVRALVGSGVPFRSLEVRPATLEEAFLSLTADA